MLCLDRLCEEGIISPQFELDPLAAHGVTTFQDIEPSALTIIQSDFVMENIVELRTGTIMMCKQPITDKNPDDRSNEREGYHQQKA